MSIFAPAPEPKTPLGKHRVLSPKAAIRVSPLCLGTMNFGDAWKDFMGECSKKDAFEILDTFYEAGGNFLDTANNYQAEESETWIGEWMQKRGVRDQMVIATKYTTNFRMGKRDEHEQQSNYTGNSTKSLHLSLERSLKKLQTSYLDILYLHWWDLTTSIEEVMNSLHRYVMQGKVLYLGVSDTPAWIVSKANQYARDHGLTPFVVYQGQWSAAKRDLERDILPMCENEGMAIAPWGALGGGNFKTAEQRKEGGGRNIPGMGPTPIEDKVTEVLEKIAKAHNSIITSVAIAYVMHATPDVYPIVGGRKVSHIKGNIEGLKLRLSNEEMEEIEKASGWSFGFPMDFLLGGKHAAHRQRDGARDSFMTNTAAHIEQPAKRVPILPSEK